MHNELTELAATLSAEQAAAPVPALPGWSVRDTYAHVAGISADFVTGHRRSGTTAPGRPGTSRSAAAGR